MNIKTITILIILATSLSLRPFSAGAQVSGSTSLTVTGSTTGNAISWNVTHQTIDGFGAAHKAVADITSAEADLCFSPSSGIGLTFLRTDVPTDGSIDGLATMQLAVARGAQVWVTPWSPPAAYKDNNSINNGGSLLLGHYQNYANYLLTWIQNAQSNGIPIYALSVQNEPDIATFYESAIWTDTQFHDFIKNNLGPTFANAGLTTKIMMPEPSSWDGLGGYDDTTLGDPVAASYVSILAAHDYDQAFDAQSVPAGKHLWETETADWGNGLDVGMDSGLYYALQVHNLMVNASINAWTFWEITGVGNVPENTNECLICNGTPAKRFYTIGNFSKYVRPGYVRIDVPSNPVGGVAVSAYKDPNTGNFAIVAINQNGSATSLTLAFNGFTSSTLTPITTSSSLSLSSGAAITAGHSFSYTLPAQSVVTFTGTAGQ